MRAPIPPANAPPPAARRAILGVTLAAGLFVAGAWAAPVLQANGSPAGGWLRLAYAPLCHQRPERSLTVAGEPLAVCARCTGLYLGGLAGMLVGAALVRRRDRWPRREWLLAAAIPTALDAVLPWLGLPQLSDVPRALLAVPLGAIAGWFLVVGLAGLFDDASRPEPKDLTWGTRPVEDADG